MDAFIGLKEQTEKACAEGDLERAEKIIQAMKTTLGNLQSNPAMTSTFNDQASALIGASAVSLFLAHARAGNVETATRIMGEISRTKTSNGQPVVNVTALEALLKAISGS